MSYEFGGCLYNSSWAMHLACAEYYLSAGGMNGHKFMKETLASTSDEDLMRDCWTNWCLDEDERYSEEELVSAFKEIRENFDYHFPLD